MAGLTYIPEIWSNPLNKVAMTGYQVEATPGRNLIESGCAEIDGRMMPVSAQVEQYDFSAQADRDGLPDFLDSYRDTTVLVNHGDRCEQFATELQETDIEATTPEISSVQTI